MGKIVTMELKNEEPANLWRVRKKQWKLEEPQNMKKQEGNYQFW